MTIVKRRAAVALATVALAALPACGQSSGGGGSAQASAKAAASKLAKDPAVIKAEAKWKPAVTRCAGQQHWILHPFHSAKATVTCAASGLTGAQRKQAELCAAQTIIANGIGHGKLAQDETGIARCLAKAAPAGPGK